MQVLHAHIVEDIFKFTQMSINYTATVFIKLLPHPSCLTIPSNCECWTKWAHKNGHFSAKRLLPNENGSTLSCNIFCNTASICMIMYQN